MHIRVTSKLLPATALAADAGAVGKSRQERHEVSFADGLWRLNGQPWGELVASGFSRTTAVHPPPPWAVEAVSALEKASAEGSKAHAKMTARIGRRLLRNDAALWDAVTARGTGVVADAAGHVRRLCVAVPMPLLLRALALLRQQHKNCLLYTSPSPRDRG